MDSEELQVLVAVARAGSFHAAALSLGLPRSTLRRRIERLEARFGATLVDATKRGATLTAAGHRVLRHGQAVLREIETMLERVRWEAEELVGELRVALPVDMPSATIEFLRRVREHHPRLRWRFGRLDYDDPNGHERFDVVIDPGEFTVPRGWSSHELEAAVDRLYASPSYLSERGVPTCAEELRDHDLLMWDIYTRDIYRLPCSDGRSLTIAPAVIEASLPSLFAFAAADLGIAFGPESRFVKPSKLGLVPVLPELVCRPRTLSLHVSADLAALPKFARLIEFICAYLSDG